MRLADIPKVRAPTMAAVIQRTLSQEGRPDAARIMPVYANGKANRLSWNLIASRKSHALVNGELGL